MTDRTERRPAGTRSDALRRPGLRLVPGTGGITPAEDELGHRVVVRWGPVDPELVQVSCRCGERASGNAVAAFVEVHSVRAAGGGVRHPSVLF